MKKAYLFLTDGFETIEALTPVDVLRRAMIEVSTVSVTGKQAVVSAHNVTVNADILLENVSDLTDADLLILPGGPGFKGLEKCEKVKSAVLAQYAARKIIAAICAAPSILARWGLLQGKSACCHASVADALKENGANICNAVVCKDGLIITSRGMGTSLPFALEMVGEVCGEKEKNSIIKAIEL